MLAGLRLDRFVGGDDEEDEIEAGGSGEHVADEAFVAGDVDEAEADAVLFEECEAEIDGDAAALFFGEAIGCVPVRASTRADLPWSMWPAVPTMMLLVEGVILRTVIQKRSLGDWVPRVSMPAARSSDPGSRDSRHFM